MLLFYKLKLSAKKSVDVVVDVVAVDDRLACVNRSDGNYAIRDVALYLICKNHKATEGKCPAGQIFTPASGKCVSISSVDSSESSLQFFYTSHPP